MTVFQQEVLKLAAAMEEGIAKTRPGTGAYVALIDDPAGPTGAAVAACAVGAAYIDGKDIAEVVNGPYVSRAAVQSEYRVLGMQADRSLHTEIVDRNDLRRQTREEIVAWLRRLAELPVAPASWGDVA